jgi:hypothetical protein
MPPVSNSRGTILTALAALLAAVFFIPYFLPVAPTVSLSFLVGYNNRAAVLLFVAGSILFGILVAKDLPDAEPNDQRLGRFSPVAASIIALLSCTWRLLPTAKHVVGSESAYTLNRVQMLASNLRPYIDFEYAYGPSHLYLPVLFAHMARCSVVRGYYLWWILQWLLGTVMLWAAIRLFDLPVPRRRILFWLLFILQLPAVRDEGAAYTPTRGFGAAFFVVAVAYFWNRAQRPIATALTALVCVSLAFAISPEQGIAVFIGLLGWFLLLAFQKSCCFSAHAAILYASGGAIIAIACWRLGEFNTLLEFSSGAFCFPLLPSPANIIILTSYVVAACIAVQYLLAGRFNSVVVPLFFAGYTLLPAALGRCDIGHLMIASPALLLGIATIESRPCIRRWWSPFAVVFVFVPVLGLALIRALADDRAKLTSSQKTATLQSDPAILSAGAAAPCRVIYRALTVAPKPNETNKATCLDTGYYFLMDNALTPRALESMVSEVEQQPLQPLVLRDQPLAIQFGPREVNVDVLYLLELSLWSPRPRNQPFTNSKLVNTIKRNYTPDLTPIDGFRIWRPMSASRP